jgi:predicted lipase
MSVNIPWENIYDMGKLMFLIYDYMEKWRVKKFSNIDHFIEKNHDLLHDNDVKILTELKEKYSEGELLKYFTNSADLQCLVGKNPHKKRITIVFRGTDGFLDCLYDILIIKTNIGNGVKIHKGFYNQLFNGGVFNKLKILIQNQLYEHPGWDIYITGHSLGAALSTISSYLLAKEFPNTKFHVITFASPKVGNYKFQQEYQSIKNLTCYRICYNKDCVTAFPTLWYYHVGHNLWFDKNKKEWHYYNQCNCKSYFLCWYYNVFDHSGINYLKCVEDTYKSDTKKIKFNT